MRTGHAAGHVGYLHEAIFYSSTDELLEVVVPFLTGGLEAGEPTVVALGETHSAAVRAALPAGAEVDYLTGGAMYARPAGAIRSYRRLLADHVAGGAGQVRIVGELPPAALGTTWNWWARYESAINHAYDEYPLWSMCAYDARTTPPQVLADVARTHPSVAAPGGRHVASGTYVEPTAYLATPRAVPADPLEAGRPAVDLVEPSPASARRVVAAAVAGRLPAETVDELLIAVSEAVSNALRHGRPPVRLRAWAGDGRAVVTVSDGGAGPTDPFAGLLPARNRVGGGLGLWLTHQLCDHVTLERTGEGFTIRLVAGS
jgi:anti-sigma regulatory factor (Ser/Thr protein kinase)